MCFPEPATSSRDLGLLHLGDESVFRPLKQVLSHHCQHLTATSSACGTVLVLLKFSSPFRSPVGSSRLFFASAFPRIGLFVSLLRVTCPFRVFEVPATSSLPQVCILSPSRFRIPPRAPKLFFTPIFLATCRHRRKNEPWLKSNNYDSNHHQQALSCRLHWLPL